jgi:hypothetical protein
MVLFGPDRYLYLGVGDGGGSGDPQGHGQNINTLLGSLLRINVDSDAFPGDSLRNYSVPPDNPFVGRTGADEIWVYGLRNPWRFWIDEPTGRLYIADVGQNAREEITILEPGSEGSNLGWNRLEGTRCYPSGGTCQTAGTVLPQVEYDHGVGRSVTGGMVYRGSRIPSLRGTYFYGDFVSGWVRSFRYDGSVRNHHDWSGRFSTSLVSSFGVDGFGEMYVVSLSGSVWRIVNDAPDGDEMFFYRDDGLYRYYDIRPTEPSVRPYAPETTTPEDGPPSPQSTSTETAKTKCSSTATGCSGITTSNPTANPLTTPRRRQLHQGMDGDHRSRPRRRRPRRDVLLPGRRPLPLLQRPDRRTHRKPHPRWHDYTKGWTSVTSVDLNGDGKDALFFYRDDGLFRYYNVRPDGSLPAPLLAGDNYTRGWTSITAVDLDGDGQDEMFFYRDDGLFRYYDIRPDGPPLTTPRRRQLHQELDLNHRSQPSVRYDSHLVPQGQRPHVDRASMKFGVLALLCAALVTPAIPASADEVYPIVFPVVGPHHFTDTYDAPRGGPTSRGDRHHGREDDPGRGRGRWNDWLGKQHLLWSADRPRRRIPELVHPPEQRHPRNR